MRICLWLAGGLAAAGIWGPAGAWGPVARAQFAMQDSTVTADLRGIAAVGDGVAWASGTRGTVLRTEDGGFVWQGCAMPPGAEALDFRGVQALDGQTALVMSSGKGTLSRVYKTVDGCRSWRMVLENPDAEGFFDAMVFAKKAADADAARGRGFIVGDPVGGKFAIFADIGDAGEKWAALTSFGVQTISPAMAGKQEALFAASNSALIATGLNGGIAFVTGGASGSRLLILEPHRALDQGTTWKFRSFDLPFSKAEAAGAFSIAGRTNGRQASDLMMVGGDYSHPDAPGFSGYLPAVKDGPQGLLPRQVRPPTTPPHGYRSSVAYEAGSKSWLTVGPNGTDVSVDDGKHWRALRPGTGDVADADRGWNAISLPYVVGPHGRIGRLREGVLGGAGAK